MPRRLSSTGVRPDHRWPLSSAPSWSSPWPGAPPSRLVVVAARADPVTRPTPRPKIGAGHRVPRTLHPVAWWIWALGLAAAVTHTTNPVLLLLVLGVLALVVAHR